MSEVCIMDDAKHYLTVILQTQIICFVIFLFWFLVVMERLVNELGSLLKMLDHETVSPATADKMASIRNILDSLQLSGTESCVRWKGQCT